MTEIQIWLLSMLGIILGSGFLGFLIGRPYWFGKGYAEGIERGGDIWLDTVFGDDDDDDEMGDEVLDARELI